VTLTRRNQYVRLSGPEVVIGCDPFHITVRFTRDEWTTTRDDVRRLDGRCAELVRGVHTDLLALHPHDPADRREWLSDGYVYQLERQIAELADERVDFPRAAGATTDLGEHLGGLAVRSEVVRRLTAQAGAAPLNRQGGWATPRHPIPDFERLIGPATADLIAALRLDATDDLSEQVTALDATFWDDWSARIADGRVSPRFCRYLAQRRLIKEVKDVWYGFGPLEELIDDPSVSEVMVVSADKIFIERRGRIDRSGRRFLTDPVTIIQRVMAVANRQINAAQPMADARLPDGSRVNAVIAPLALTGPCLTLRKFPPKRFTMADLAGRLDALTKPACEFLRAAVADRRNLIVSGGTGSGKTTMLNCLSEFIDPRDRVVTIEDTAELQVVTDHLVTLQARPKNLEGAGAVSIRDLVRNALRMRPDRILVGECRGGEAVDMLQAMNTGHDGSMTTLHANDPAGAVHRLVTLVQENADVRLPVDVIHRQIVTAVDLIVQLGEVYRDGVPRRVVTEVAEVAGYDPEEGVIALTPLFHRRGAGPLTPTGHLPSFLSELLAAGLVGDPTDLLTEGALRTTGDLVAGGG
jgi:pilus assembly protein CpaF